MPMTLDFNGLERKPIVIVVPLSLVLTSLVSNSNSHCTSARGHPFLTIRSLQSAEVRPSRGHPFRSRFIPSPKGFKQNLKEMEKELRQAELMEAAIEMEKEKTEELKYKIKWRRNSCNFVS